MPNKANLRLWVAALRSGAYEQGRNLMRQTDGGKTNHCCLGVAQEVALRAGHTPANDICWGVTSTMENSIFDEFYGLEKGGPFRSVMLDVEVTLDPAPVHAAVLNDSWGWTFNQIADAIEKTFDLLTYDEIFDPEFVPTNETVAT